MKYLKKFEHWMRGGEPDLSNPIIKDSVLDFYKKLGVDITPAEPGQEPNVSMRISPSMILYSFKIKEDMEKFKEYLSSRDWYKYDETYSEGARYPFQIVIERGIKNEQKVGDYGIGTDIDNEYSKIINGSKGGKLDLGVVGKVPEATLYNIKQTYKDAVIKIVDDHYILTRK